MCQSNFQVKSLKTRLKHQYNIFKFYIEGRAPTMKKSKPSSAILTGRKFRDQIIKMIGNEEPCIWAKKHKIKKEVMDTILKGNIPDLPDLFKLSQALHITLDALLTGRKPGKSYSGEEQEYIDKVVGVLRSKQESSKESLKNAIHVYYCLICE